MSRNFLFLGVQVGLTPGQHEVPDAKQPNQNQLLEKISHDVTGLCRTGFRDGHRKDDESIDEKDKVRLTGPWARYSPSLGSLAERAAKGALAAPSARGFALTKRSPH